MSAPRFLGFDHVDVRVRSLPLVEAFYDALMPRLGLPVKTLSHVDDAGEWMEPDEGRPYNTVEYGEEPEPGTAPRFIGFIEARDMTPVASRIAFAVSAPEAVAAWEPELEMLGARNIERAPDFDHYPAVFFEDPAGTRLELCARRKRG